MGDAVNSKNLVALAIWGIAIGIIHLAGYWGSFGINPFEYMDGRGLFQAGLFSLVGSIALLILGALIGHLIVSPLFPAGGGADKPIGRMLAPLWRWLGVLNLILITSIVLFVPAEGKWYVVASLVALFSLLIRDSSLLIAVTTAQDVRSILAFLLIFIPMIALARGIGDASIARSSDARRLIDLSGSVIPAGQNLSGEISYVGRLGDTYVLFELSTSRLVLLDRSSSPQLLIRARDAGG